MLASIEGIYSNGRVQLSETPNGLDKARVIVTFLPDSRPQELSAYGIDEAQAADLRARLRTFEEDWDRPDMGGYDAL